MHSILGFHGDLRLDGDDGADHSPLHLAGISCAVADRLRDMRAA
jgi:hypothetical protein